MIDELKQLEPSSLVLVLTSYPSSVYRQRAADAGADFFFDKSTELHKVPEALRNGRTECQIQDASLW